MPHPQGKSEWGSPAPVEPKEMSHHDTDTENKLKIPEHS